MPATSRLSLLPYTLSTSTSHDSTYTSPSPQIQSFPLSSTADAGFISERFSLYPQSFTVKLKNVGLIGEIKLLSHECFISERIEILLGSATSSSPSSSTSDDDESTESNITYKRLGYLNLSPNSKSNHKARELKCVNLSQGVKGQYVKFVMRRNFENERNLFGQVGVVGVEVWGVNCGGRVMRFSGGDNLQVKHRAVHKYYPEPPPSNSNMRERTFTTNMNMNTTITTYTNTNTTANANQASTSRLTAVLKSKKRSVATGNYILAKSHKQIELTLRSIITQITTLDSHLCKAVGSEDYEEAFRLKDEICKLDFKGEKLLSEHGIEVEGRGEVEFLECYVMGLEDGVGVDVDVGGYDDAGDDKVRIEGLVGYVCKRDGEGNPEDHHERSNSNLNSSMKANKRYIENHYSKSMSLRIMPSPPPAPPTTWGDAEEYYEEEDRLENERLELETLENERLESERIEYEERVEQERIALERKLRNEALDAEYKLKNALRIEELAEHLQLIIAVQTKLRVILAKVRLNLLRVAKLKKENDKILVKKRLLDAAKKIALTNAFARGGKKRRGMINKANTKSVQCGVETRDVGSRPYSAQPLEHVIFDKDVLVKAKAMARVFGIDAIKLIFSKEWNYRVQGFEGVREVLQGLSSEKSKVDAVFQELCDVLFIGFEDKSWEVIDADFSLLLILKEVYTSSSLSLKTSSQALEPTIRLLLTRLSSTSSRISSTSLASLTSLVQITGPSYLSLFALKRLDKYELTNNARTVVNRLTLLTELVRSAADDGNEESAQVLASACLKFINDCSALDSPSSDSIEAAKVLEDLCLKLMGGNLQSLMSEHRNTGHMKELIAEQIERYTVLQELVDNADALCEGLEGMSLNVEGFEKVVSGNHEMAMGEVDEVFDRLIESLNHRRECVKKIVSDVTSSKASLLVSRKNEIGRLNEKISQTKIMAEATLSAMHPTEYSPLVQPLTTHLQKLTGEHERIVGIPVDGVSASSVRFVSGGREKVLAGVLESFGAVVVSGGGEQEGVSEFTSVDGYGEEEGEDEDGERNGIHMTIKTTAQPTTHNSNSNGNGNGSNNNDDIVTIEIRNGSEKTVASTGVEGEILGRVVIVNSVERAPRDKYSCEVYFESLFTSCDDRTDLKELKDGGGGGGGNGEDEGGFEDDVTVIDDDDDDDDDDGNNDERQLSKNKDKNKGKNIFNKAAHRSRPIPTTRFTKLLKFGPQDGVWAQKLRKEAEMALKYQWRDDED